MSRGWRKLEHRATGADTAIDRVGARSRSAVRGAVESACSVQRQSLRWILAIRTALEAIQNGLYHWVSSAAGLSLNTVPNPRRLSALPPELVVP